jgi:starch-binding outer membrane protein, SusD/RagB family
MRLLFLYCLLCYAGLSCRKLIDVGEPSDKIVGEEVYASDSNAAAVMAGIYSYINKSGLSAGGTGISVFCGLYCDELDLLEGNQEFQRCYETTLTADDSPFWAPLYHCVQHCNLLLEGLLASKAVTPAVKKQLMGEAKFIRAFSYFYLVNFFGDVPLLTTTDLNNNMNAGRSSIQAVYEQIVSDLRDAKLLLKEDYLAGDAHTVVRQRLRPNKWAAAALLARAYLYSRSWVAAEQEASDIIAQEERYSIPPLSGAFLEDSKEMIWGLENVNTTGVNEDAALLVLQHGPDQERQPVFLNERLLQAFEQADQRLTTWIGKDTILGTVYYYPHKYRLADDERSPTPYLAVLRFGEVLLIRAEAKVYMNDFSGAWADLKHLTRRAGLGYTPAMNRTSLLAAIERERRVELFTEWGHRWLDLKRWNKADDTMLALQGEKGVDWNTYKKLFPIPHNDILLNPNLKQNLGY